MPTYPPPFMNKMISSKKRTKTRKNSIIPGLTKLPPIIKFFSMPCLKIYPKMKLNNLFKP